MRPTRHWMLGLLVAGACTSTEPPPGLPAGAVPHTPSANFAEWWQETAACSGLSVSARQQAGVTWFVVPGAETFDAGNGHQVTGLWERTADGGSIIVIAGRYSEHEMVVRHEMLHALIGKAGHPAEYFEQRCQLTWTTWGE